MTNLNIEFVENAHDFYVRAFKPGEYFTRREIAETNKLAYTTVVYNLEKAVSKGKLAKHKYLVNGQPTWIYGLPDTMQQLALRGGQS